MDKPNREVLSVLLDAYFNEDYEIDEANAHVVSALGKDGLATIVVDEGIGAQPFGTNDPYIEFTEKGKAFMESLLDAMAAKVSEDAKNAVDAVQAYRDHWDKYEPATY